MLRVASIYDVKPAFQRLLGPASGVLGRAHITPNQVTIAALALSFINGAAILVWPAERWPFIALPITLFVRMSLNALDGMMARSLNLASPLGAVLNEVGDVISDAGLYLPLAYVPGCPSPLIVIVVLLGVISEMTGVVAVQIGASRRYEGPMGKSDRAFVFGAIGLLLGAGVPVGRWTTALLAIVIALGAITIVNRALRAIQEKTR